MSTSLVTVNFHGDELQAVRTDGGVQVVVKRVCDMLGIDHSSQVAKLKNQAWATMGPVTTVAEDGRSRELLCIHLDCLPMWLATVDVGRVREELRGKLVSYQKECARALRDHFFGVPGMVELVAEPLQLKSSIRDGLEFGFDMLVRLGVPEGVAAAHSMRDAEPAFGISLAHTMRALPGATSEIAALNATAVGKELGCGAQKANKLLVQCGLQLKNERNEWVATDAGREHSSLIPFSNATGHDGYQLLWKTSVLPLLSSAVST